jgi:hypothetical protein
MRKLFVGVVSLGILGASSVVLADETARPPHRPPVVIHVDISVRRQQPLAAIDVGRVSPAVAVRALRQPFVERIERCTEHEPF